MPLKEGKTKSVVSENISEMISGWKKSGSLGASRPKNIKEAMKQATAIAFTKARGSKSGAMSNFLSK